jgi:hypothetical protein
MNNMSKSNLISYFTFHQSMASRTILKINIIHLNTFINRNLSFYQF